MDEEILMILKQFMENYSSRSFFDGLLELFPLAIINILAYIFAYVRQMRHKYILLSSVLFDFRFLCERIRFSAQKWKVVIKKS